MNDRKVLMVSNSHPESSQNRLMRFGLEFEVPFMPDDDTHLMSRGKSTDNEETAWFPDGELDYEWISARPDTYGWECRTDGTMGPRELVDWYTKTYHRIERHEGRIEPVGYHDEGTAGLHIHLSEISEEDAKLIRRASTKPWMQLLACSSVAAYDTDGELLPKYHVLRGKDPDVKNPCKDKRVGGPGRGKIIAARRGTGHYEWRLPEPMWPVNFRHLMEVLTRLLESGMDLARSVAHNIIEQRSHHITSVKRARKIQQELGDLPEMKDRRNETTDLLLEVM